MKMEKELHQLNFGDSNTPIIHEGIPVTVVPMDIPKTVDLDQKDFAEFSKDPYWLSRMISQEWRQIIPRGANGVSVGKIFSKENLNFVGIQFYYMCENNTYVDKDVFESEFTQFKSLTDGIENLLSTPIQSLNEKTKLLQTGQYQHTDKKINYKTARTAKPLALKIKENGRVYSEDDECRLAQGLVPVELPLIIEMPDRSSYDVWRDFDIFLEKEVLNFLPRGANAYVSEDTVYTRFTPTSHLRSVQPYKLLSEKDRIPYAYINRLKEENICLESKINSLDKLTLKEMYALIKKVKEDA